MPKRFNTFFFIGEHLSRSVKIDQQEICDYCWLPPFEALQEHRDGKLSLPPPTFVTLHQLSKFKDTTSAIKALSDNPITYRPKLILTNTGFHSVYEEDSGYKHERLEIDKPVHRLIIDEGKFEYLSEY